MGSEGLHTTGSAGRGALKLFLTFAACCLALFGLLAALAELFAEGLAAPALAALAGFAAFRIKKSAGPRGRPAGGRDQGVSA